MLTLACRRAAPRRQSSSSSSAATPGRSCCRSSRSWWRRRRSAWPWSSRRGPASMRVPWPAVAGGVLVAARRRRRADPRRDAAVGRRLGDVRRPGRSSSPAPTSARPSRRRRSPPRTSPSTTRPAAPTGSSSVQTGAGVGAVLHTVNAGRLDERRPERRRHPGARHAEAVDREGARDDRAPVREAVAGRPRQHRARLPARRRRSTSSPR